MVGGASEPAAAVIRYGVGTTEKPARDEFYIANLKSSIYNLQRLSNFEFSYF